MNESFGTISETVNGLIKLGYTHDFNIQEECLVTRNIHDNGEFLWQINVDHKVEQITDLILKNNCKHIFIPR